MHNALLMRWPEVSDTSFIQSGFHVAWISPLTFVSDRAPAFVEDDNDDSNHNIRKKITQQLLLYENIHAAFPAHG